MDCLSYTLLKNNTIKVLKFIHKLNLVPRAILNFTPFPYGEKIHGGRGWDQLHLLKYLNLVVNKKKESLSPIKTWFIKKSNFSNLGKICNICNFLQVQLREVQEK